MSKKSNSETIKNLKVAKVLGYLFGIILLPFSLIAIAAVPLFGIICTAICVFLLWYAHSCSQKIKRSQSANHTEHERKPETPMVNNKPASTPVVKDSVTTNYNIPNTRKFPMRVVGVSFDNDDGTNRQDIISSLSEGDDVDLEPYEYNGSPAVYVMVDNKIIGNIPKTNTKEIFNRISNNEIVDASIKRIIGGDIGDNYGVIIEIEVEN